MYLITWITTHLPTPEGWMAELAKARRMQSYIILYKTIAARCEKLAQGFYTAATTWPGIEPRINNTLVRRSTSKPPRHCGFNRHMSFIIIEDHKTALYA